MHEIRANNDMNQFENSLRLNSIINSLKLVYKSNELNSS